MANVLRKALVVNVGNINGVTGYTVLVAEVSPNSDTSSRNMYNWRFVKDTISERELIRRYSQPGIEWVNVVVENGKVKGKEASLSRFTDGGHSMKPYTIIAQVTNGERLLGYLMSDCAGNVKRVPIRDALELAYNMHKNGLVPIQNAIYVPADDNKRAFIKSYPNSPFFEDIIRKSAAVPNTVNEEARENMKATEKNISVLDIFTKEQAKELKIGKDKGVNFKLYANPKLTPKQMEILRKGLEHKVPDKIISVLSNGKFDEMQIQFYILDSENGLDITSYIDPRYSIAQIEEISNAYELGLDISKLTNPKLSPDDMADIRERMQRDIWSDNFLTEDGLMKLDDCN